MALLEVRVFLVLSRFQLGMLYNASQADVGLFASYRLKLQLQFSNVATSHAICHEGFSGSRMMRAHLEIRRARQGCGRGQTWRASPPERRSAAAKSGMRNSLEAQSRAKRPIRQDGRHQQRSGTDALHLDLECRGPFRKRGNWCSVHRELQQGAPKPCQLTAALRPRRASIPGINISIDFIAGGIGD